MLRETDLQKASRFCICVSAVILGLSGLFKLISAAGTARMLSTVDPLFGITSQQFFLLAGVVEVGTVAVVLRSRNYSRNLILIAALGTDFLLYRAGLRWLGIGHPCPCLGNAAAWTHLPATTMDLITISGLGWLIGSSYVLLLLLLFRSRVPRVALQNTA
jgi:hypothetical protein